MFVTIILATIFQEEVADETKFAQIGSTMTMFAKM